jgi:ribosomal protein S3
MNNEQMMNLLQEISEVQAAGNHVHLTYNNFGVDVLIMRGQLKVNKKWEKEFYFSRVFSGEKNNEIYKKCREYLSKMKETV